VSKPNHGDDVARFAIRHDAELMDVDAFESYLLQPLDHCLRLKTLQQGGAEVRARRLAAETPQPPWQDGKNIAIGGLCVAFVVLLVRAWRNRKKPTTP